VKKRYLPNVFDELSNSVTGSGQFNFKKIDDDYDVSWRREDEPLKTDTFKNLSTDDSKKELRRDLGTLIAKSYRELIDRDRGPKEYFSRLVEYELDWLYWATVTTNLMPTKTKRHLYTRPILTDEKIVYKGRRFWVVEVKASSCFFGHFSEYDFFVWDGLYDAVIGVAKELSNGKFKCEIVVGHGFGGGEATDYRHIASVISSSVDFYLDSIS
jgi:hypothetical protein